MIREAYNDIICEWLVSVQFNLSLDMSNYIASLIIPISVVKRLPYSSYCNFAELQNS